MSMENATACRGEIRLYAGYTVTKDDPRRFLPLGIVSCIREARRRWSGEDQGFELLHGEIRAQRPGEVFVIPHGISIDKVSGEVSFPSDSSLSGFWLKVRERSLF